MNCTLVNQHFKILPKICFWNSKYFDKLQKDLWIDWNVNEFEIKTEKGVNETYQGRGGATLWN